jgi:CBS domain containing-hemolysin-like protein
MVNKSNIPQSFWKRLLHTLPGGRRRVLTEKDLQLIIEESEAEGVINEEEGEMLHSIFTLGETIVREIMVPRTDMVCCAVDAGVANILQAIIAAGHSRVPVYEGSADQIVGIVYAKDLLRYWGVPDDDIDLKSVMREPYFVPETKNVEELLQEFRSKRVHLAIAVDEYGGTSGLITIEDLLEEIVGDIQDEFDREEALLTIQPDGAVLVDARMGLEEFEEYFKVAVARDKIDSVGGYLCDLFGHVPSLGEEIVDHGLQMCVVESDARTIRKVRITVNDDSATVGGAD